jgi:hypothetical protein
MLPTTGSITVCSNASIFPWPRIASPPMPPSAGTKILTVWLSDRAVVGNEILPLAKATFLFLRRMRLSSCQALGNVEATCSLDHFVGSRLARRDDTRSWPEPYGARSSNHDLRRNCALPSRKVFFLLRSAAVTSTARPTRRAQRKSGGAALEAPAKRLAAATPLARKESTDRNVISIGVSERELHGLSVRIHVRLLFETSDECACPLER